MKITPSVVLTLNTRMKTTGQSDYREDVPFLLHQASLQLAAIGTQNTLTDDKNTVVSFKQLQMIR